MSHIFFDGHNDTLLKLASDSHEAAVDRFLQGDDTLHIDLPRSKTVGFKAGLFAMFTPSPERYDFEEYQSASGCYEVPMPPPIDPDRALRFTNRMIDIAEIIAKRSGGAVKICKDSSDLSNFAERELTMVLHIEGADCIDAEMKNLDELYARGLRSLGITWSRNNLFGNGVPFKFPATPDIGRGLTEHGHNLVARCNEMKIALDVSHLNEQGFWDVKRQSQAPIFATHSNAYELCNSPRNLTDDQLRAIADSGGVVGINFAPCFLASNGLIDVNISIEHIVDQYKYLHNILGDNGIALGSDFDGVPMPKGIGDVTGLPNVVVALQAGGISSNALDKFTFHNWYSALRDVI